LKIADFGLSTKINSLTEVHSVYVGTICSAAPQIRFREGVYTGKCDVFSLGVVYYWMIYGAYPFRDQMEKHEYLEYQLQMGDYGVDNFIVADDVKKLIRSMLAYDEAKRPDWNYLFNHFFFKPFLDSF
jgi:serine/threonine protein kinase